MAGNRGGRDEVAEADCESATGSERDLPWLRARVRDAGAHAADRRGQHGVVHCLRQA